MRRKKIKKSDKDTVQGNKEYLIDIFFADLGCPGRGI